MFAGNEEERKGLAEHIEKDGMMIEEVEDIEDEGCGCAELSGEKENGCTILKIWKWNIEPLYIAYYKDYLNQTKNRCYLHLGQSY